MSFMVAQPNPGRDYAERLKREMKRLANIECAAGTSHQAGTLVSALDELRVKLNDLATSIVTPGAALGFGAALHNMADQAQELAAAVQKIIDGKAQEVASLSFDPFLNREQ